MIFGIIGGIEVEWNVASKVRGFRFCRQICNSKKKLISVFGCDLDVDFI